MKLIRFLLRLLPPDQLDDIQEFVELLQHGIRLVNAHRKCILLYWWCVTGESVQFLLEWIDSGRLAATIEKLINVATAGQEQLSVRCLVINKTARRGMCW